MNDKNGELFVADGRIRSAGPTLADAIQRSRRQSFVGRSGQCRSFAAALRGAVGAPQVFLFYGLGGIGKSSLLRRFADAARDAGRPTVWVDGDLVNASATAFEQRAQDVRTIERAVLFVDGFEHCESLETWLREQFLPTVSARTLVVVAGRRRPQPQWTLDPGWRDLVSVEQLGPLAHDEIVALLAERGVAPARHRAVRDFAGGHPLALSLAAAAAATDSFDSSMWEPGPDVVRALLGHLVDHAPSAAHRFGLQVAAHVRHTTVELLRTGLDADTAVTVFDWLAELPYVESSRSGLRTHDLVRDVLDADFGWRDREKYTELHLRLWRCLGERVQAAANDEVETAAAELLHLLQYGTADQRDLFSAVDTEAVFERSYSPQLREGVLRLTRDHQGEEQARLAAYWLDRQPEGFRVYCRVSDLRVVSFTGWLRVNPNVDDFAADPVLSPIGEYVDQRGLAPGDHVGICRFLVPAPVADRYTTGSVLHIARMSVANMRRQDRLAVIFLLLPSAELSIFKMELFGYTPLEWTPDLGQRSWTVLVRDWRTVPASSPLDRVAIDRAPPPAGRATGPARGVLPRKAHADAARRALRDWHDDEALAANPLVQVYGDVAAVRAALSAALGALKADPDWIRHQRIVRATYLERTTGQEATAAHLGIPFSTYRRYLSSGVEQVCANLWYRAADSPDS